MRGASDTETPLLDPAPAAPAAEHVRVESARTLSELQRVRDFHVAHEWHHESSHDLLVAALAARDDGSEPCAFTVRRGGRVEAMLVGQLVRAVVPWRIGYKVVHRSPLRLLEVLQGGFLGELSQANVEALYDAVTRLLQNGAADGVLLRNVPTDSVAYEVFRHRAGPAFCDGAAERATNWRMTLPESYDAWRAGLGKKAREDLRRYENRIRRAFGERVSVVEKRRPDDVTETMAVVDGIACKTWQRGLGAGFWPTAEARARWGAAASRGSLRVFVLFLGGAPAAFCSGFLLGGTLWLEHVGYDPAFAAYRPGGYLLQQVIERACREEELRFVDFGTGDADYKRRLCDLQRDEARLYLFAPTLKGLWLSTMRRLSRRVGSVSRALIGRLGLAGSIKRRWRRRIAEKQKNARRGYRRTGGA